MDLYLTPGQFRNLDLGVDVSGWIDAKLAPKLAQASADVNAFCQAPNVPVPHSFLGGVITGETHSWRTDPFGQRATRRAFPYHTPVRSIESMRIYVTTDQYVDLTPAELYYETSEGWVEPASANLTSYGLFGSSVLPFIGLSDPHATLDYTYGYRIPETVRLWYQGDGGYTWRAPSGFWTSDAIEVRVNDAIADPGDYTIDRTEGTITWDIGTQPSGTARVEADVVSRIPYDISLATGIIAAERISGRAIVEDGFPEGIRSMRVAEVSIDRGLTRVGDVRGGVEIPDKAAELLGTYVFRPLAIV